MRADCFAMSRAEALAAVARAGLLHIAAVTPGGPLLRTFDGVVLNDSLCFHGDDRGTKLEFLGRDVMVTAEELVAHLPSWFFDEQRACPATTYYRSVHAWGRVERIESPPHKAAVLQALMERYQPEGRHRPVLGEDPLYAKVVRSLLVVRIRPVRIVGKAKLGQHKGARTIERALDGLWRRGQPGDLRALRIIREAHPARPRTAWMRGPRGAFIEVAPDEREVDEATALVADEYWNDGVERDRVRAAHRASPAWIVAKDADGRVIGTVRAMSDHAMAATVFDLAVEPQWRGRGLGRGLMDRLLDHPRIRGTRRVRLWTRDAHDFYAPLGFEADRSRPDVLVRRAEPRFAG